MYTSVQFAAGKLAMPFRHSNYTSLCSVYGPVEVPILKNLVIDFTMGHCNGNSMVYICKRWVTYGHGIHLYIYAFKWLLSRAAWPDCIG